MVGSARPAAGPCPMSSANGSSDEWLPEPLRQRLTHEARDGVGCLACRKGDDDPYRPPGMRYNQHLEHDDGETVFRHACKLGLEGIVSKRKDSSYRSGRRRTG